MPTRGREWAEAQAEARVAELRETLEDFLAGSAGPVGLEIGCGHGHWLAGLAAARPEGRWVGVDLVSRRIRKAEAKAARLPAGNALFLKADATEVLRAWPSHPRPDSFFLLHPDPWPKARHAARRLTGPLFLDLMAEVAAPGALLFFRTDDPPFFAWSEASLQEHPRWERTAADWPHEGWTYFGDLLGVHGHFTARRLPGPRDAGPAEETAPPPFPEPPPPGQRRPPASPGRSVPPAHRRQTPPRPPGSP